MADISTEITEIQEASYGSEVRQSIVDGLNKVNAGTLPAVSVSDAGKFLKVNNEGEWEVGSGGLIPTPTGTKNITENGTHDVTNYASANVDVEPDLGTKNITQNGTYNASSDDLDGYSSVVVDVQGGGGGGGTSLIDIFGTPQSNIGANYEITSDRGVWSDAYQYNAFNTNVGGPVWGSEAINVPAWLIYKFTDNKKRVIKFIDFVTAISAYGGGFTAASFQLQGSNDDFVTYDVLLDYTNGAQDNNTCVQLSGNSAYSAFRFYITSISRNWYPAVNRIKAFGYIEGEGTSIEPPSVTQNGTYTPPSGVDGFAPVVVSVSGGGGVELMTRDQWDALTMQQKKSYGFVGIQDRTPGYICGQLVYGAYYNEYLPYSQDASAFDCIATYDNFDPNSLTWGDGDNPIQFSALCAQYMSEDAVYCDAKSSSKQIYIPLDSTTSDFTVYVVLKGLAYVAGAGVQVIGSVGSWSGGRIINYNSYYASNTWRSSTWGNDSDFINTGGNYVVLAIRSENLKASWFGYSELERLNVSYSQHGSKFEMGYREVGSSYESDLAVKFVALIQEAEDIDIIRNNIINLANVFNIA